MRLIDADALTQKESVMRKGCAYIEEINHAPTIDAEPVKHGEWIEERNITTDGKGYTAYRCSVCQYAVLTKLYNFCPNCGAKMDG